MNNSTFGPTSYTNQPYVAPNADVTRTPTHKVAIVYSDTTAANYFRGLGDAAGAPSTAYSDLFMAAQNQARMAGVSYDVIDESQLTEHQQSDRLRRADLPGDGECQHGATAGHHVGADQRGL